MPLSAGTRLGRYEMLSVIGAGGMGESTGQGIHDWTGRSPLRFCPPASPRSTSALYDIGEDNGQPLAFVRGPLRLFGGPGQIP